MLIVKELLDYIKYLKEKTLIFFYWWDYPQFLFFDKYKEKNQTKIITIIKKVFKNLDNSDSFGLYVHLPFCNKKCRFCGFYSEINRNNLIDDYIDSIEKEINWYKKIKVDFKKIKFSSIYLGGGTPTLLSSVQLERLLKLLFKNFKFLNKSQRTTEGTPESLTENKIKILEKFGFNRFTLGVQSFNNDILKKYNRNSSLKEILKTYKLLKKSKIKYINIDMMLGLKGENKSVYDNYLKYIKKLAPDQISFEILSPEASQIFSKKEKREMIHKVHEMEFFLFFYITKKMGKIGYQNLGNKDRCYYFIKKQRLSHNVINYQITNHRKSFYPVLALGQGGNSKLFTSSGKLISINNTTISIQDYVHKLKENSLNKIAHIYPRIDVLRSFLIFNFNFYGIAKIDIINNFFKNDVLIEFKNIFQPLLKDKMIEIKKGNLILLDNYKKLSKNYNLTEREKYFFFVVNYLYPQKIHEKIRNIIIKKKT